MPLSDTVDQVARILSKQPGLTVETRTVRKPWDACSTALNYGIGFSPGKNTGDDIFADAADKAEMIVSSVQATRLPGGLGEISVTTIRRDPAYVWGVDWAEIQKPIRTWNYDSQTDKPDLNALALWERLRDSDPETYTALKYYDSGTTGSLAELTGPTRSLAEKILKGIEYYAVYTPVITKTSYLGFFPGDVGGVGTVTSSPAGDGGSEELTGGASPAKINALAKSWLKTADRISGNLDGSIVRQEVWTGADAWDPDLYPAAGAQA